MQQAVYVQGQNVTVNQIANAAPGGSQVATVVGIIAAVLKMIGAALPMVSWWWSSRA